MTITKCSNSVSISISSAIFHGRVGSEDEHPKLLLQHLWKNSTVPRESRRLVPHDFRYGGLCDSICGLCDLNIRINLLLIKTIDDFIRL
jgi:hypothetical protein